MTNDHLMSVLYRTLFAAHVRRWWVNVFRTSLTPISIDLMAFSGVVWSSASNSTIVTISPTQWIFHSDGIEILQLPSEHMRRQHTRAPPSQPALIANYCTPSFSNFQSFAASTWQWPSNVDQFPYKTSKRLGVRSENLMNVLGEFWWEINCRRWH